eukprot:CAMPEP_0178488820 /NCGR_PEP_ID=MMETSP0696-20121128/10057_1 /TAXON_ID=265572 /ORGANISM="Extubocellulus spinifer, Strain CCMP396" /LENGTH=814 /DNA_ID=CAMNT_0020116601 /DNA_START=367 /DNA_END=2811 /DNA_ORIENTATION=-
MSSPDKDDSPPVDDVEMEDAAAAADADAAKDAPDGDGADGAETTTSKRRRSSRTKQPPPETNGSGAATKNGGKSKNGTAKTKKSTKREPIVYRWIGPGTTEPDGRVVYTKLEMRVGGRAALVRTGDCALLCSGDVTEDVLYGHNIGSDESPERHSADEEDENKNRDHTEEPKLPTEGKVPNDEENALYGSPNAANLSAEEDELYASCFNDDAINKLDPFVARIEKMWEDPPEDGPDAEQRRARDAKLLGKNYDERRSRMKIQARWFYKKEDIQGLTSHFVGVSRRDLIATMSPRELILGDQADDNEVSTILGKCRVVRRSPLSKQMTEETPAGTDTAATDAASAEEEELPLGAYACRYGLTLHPPARAGAAGTVVFSPYDGEDPGLDAGDDTGSTVGDTSIAATAKHARGDDRENDPEPANKRRRTGSGAGRTDTDAQSSVPDSRRTSEIDSGKTGSSSSDEEEIANETDTGDTGPPATEGSQLHGSIHVGPGHQAVVPPLDKESAIRSRGPKLVWSPSAISEENIDDYLKKAADVLKGYMEKRGLEIAPTPHIDEFETGVATAATSKKADVSAEGSDAAAGEVAPRKLRVVFRECDIDKLLANLHHNEYDTDAAIKSLESNPDPYLTIWNRQQKELFNSGFRRYYGSLRMIGKGVGRSKGHKDVVDYFYRFKIPEQFCKYKDRKREQAKRILQTVEKRKLRDALAEDGEDGRSLSPISGSSAKRTRDLSKTAGASPSSIGQVEKRKIMARELLCVIRDTIGAQNYLKICKLLKANQNRKGSIPSLKGRAEDLLGDHPELLDRFIAFLPKKHRN